MSVIEIRGEYPRLPVRDDRSDICCRNQGLNRRGMKPTRGATYEIDRVLHLGRNEWHETTLSYRPKGDSEHDDHRQYSVFVTNRGSWHH